jgi:hypothetical protein
VTRIALVHATPLAIAPVNEAFARLWPAAERMNLLDDSLSADRAAAGALTDSMIERFRALAGYCVAHGAAGVLFTCSAFGPAIEAARAAVSVPVLKPNEAMLAEALGLAGRGSGRIALLATFAPTIASIADEFRQLAAARSVGAELVTHHVAGAMAALDSGNAPRHDALIADALEQWAGWRDCDGILLAQFSMARARAPVAERAGIPVLVSTDSAVVGMRRAMGA